MGLSNRRRVFVEEYLQCWNATEAARRAGYAHPNKQGPYLLVNIGIKAVIEARIDELAMSADEVLKRLADHGRADIIAFLDERNELSLEKAKDNNVTHLIKKLKQRTVETEAGRFVTTELELHDAQAALVQLGRHHGLFLDRSDITSNGEKLETGNSNELNRALSTLADAIGKALPGADAKPEGAVDAAECATMASNPVEG